MQKKILFPLWTVVVTYYDFDCTIDGKTFNLPYSKNKEFERFNDAELFFYRLCKFFKVDKKHIVAGNNFRTTITTKYPFDITLKSV